MAGGELSLIDRNISSLLDVPVSDRVTSLNLHCNRIPRIQGLTAAWRLRHLDLSSNSIARIEGLGSLASLRTLNLSCNAITKVEGLNGLVNLTRLNLSYNHIQNLTGLLYLHGEEHKLRHLSLHSNRLDSMSQLLQCMLGLQSLRDVTLSADGKDNPVCSSAGYREVVLQALPQISSLDRVDRLGHPASALEDHPLDIPGLEDYVEILLSDACAEELVGPAQSTGPIRRAGSLQGSQAGRVTERNKDQRIQDRENRVSQRSQQIPAGHASSSPPAPLELRVPRRDIDNTSESESDRGKDGGRRTRVGTAARHRSSSPARRTRRPATPRSSHSDQESRRPGGLKCAAGQRRKTAAPTGASGKADAPGRGRKPLDTPKTPGGERTAPSTEEDTYRALVAERDQERERRWRAEQALRRLAEQMSALHHQASQDKDLQNRALLTSDRLKEVLLRERSEGSGLRARVEELEGRSQGLVRQLEQSRQREDQQQGALRSLEESTSQREALRARQQAEEMQRQRDVENRAIALSREAQIHRAQAKQHKDKLQQLQELLASREQAHRKELESRLAPGGAEFCEAVGREVRRAEQRHARREAELEERLAEARRQYGALEDEFRMALAIEAARFTEVKEGCDHLSAELSEVKSALSQSQQREQQSGALVQELTCMVKEQKSRIAELIRARKDAVTELKARLRVLETGAEQDGRLGLQLELLKKDKSRLLSQLSAQESAVDGLRAERRVWGQELAQQGVSLAQDRGRLEARIEVLSTELDTQKKQNERDSDAARIRAKVIDDQTETIHKLKQAVLERDEAVRGLREEGLQAQRRAEQQLAERTAPLEELRERLEQLGQRKDRLKQQLEDKERELDTVNRAYSASSKKWQEKAELLSRLEVQVKRMKESFDAKEALLLDERDRAAHAHKAAVEKLHDVDDAFRRQLESVQASHQAELLRLANEKLKQVELANQRVFGVEEEMRQLLEEVESKKRRTEEKMIRLAGVLKDF